MIPRFPAHPPEATRIAFALRDAALSDRAEIARHVLQCNDCHTEIARIERLQSMFRDEPHVPPGDSILNAVLADRAAGQRYTIPVRRPRNDRQPRLWLAGCAVAAGIIAIAGLASAPGSDAGDAGDTSPARTMAVLLTPSEAFAQTPGPHHATTLAAERITAIRNGRWEYLVRGWNGRKVVDRFMLVETVSRPKGTLQLLRHFVDSAGTFITDTAQMDLRSLAPIRRAFWRKGIRQFEELAHDDRITRTHRTRDRTGVVMTSAEFPLPQSHRGKPLLLSMDIPLPLLLRAAPLSPGSTYRADAIRRYSSASHPGGEIRQLVIRVDGPERVKVPAGRFDAWRLTASAADGSRHVWWVDRQAQVLLRSAGFKGKQLLHEMVLSRQVLD